MGLLPAAPFPGEFHLVEKRHWPVRPAPCPSTRSWHMNRLVTRSLALALFALVVTPVFAQRQPGFGFGGGQMGIAQLVTNKSVQEELKLTEDQIAKLKSA